MTRSSRADIEQYAKEAFAVNQDQIHERQAQRRTQALQFARLSGNRGAYVPAITRYTTEAVRESILALADAYVEAFTLFGLSSETWSEAALRTSAQQIAGGATAGAIGQIERHAGRTRQPVADEAAGHIHREVGHSMLSALREGTLRLKRQRIKLEKSMAVPPEHSEGPGTSRSAHSGVQGLRSEGPDDVELLIEPYQDGFVWRIRNRSLRAVQNVGIQVVGVRSYDADKAAFRESTKTFSTPWPGRYTLAPGDLMKGIIFVALEGDRLRLGDTTGTNWLPWPSGDSAQARRWLLSVNVLGLSTAWPVELDLRWTVGTKTLEIIEAGCTLGTNGNGPTAHYRGQEAVVREEVVKLFPAQEYPKSMHHATKPPIIVNSAAEQAVLGPEWSETYVHQAYPKCKYTWNEKTVTVKDPAEEAALGPGWADTPAAFKPFMGPRPPREARQDATKWVDQWSVAGLTPTHRNRIKAELLRADAAFWRSPDAPSSDLNALRQAFTGVAKALSEAGLLTEGLLRDELPQFVWDSAIAGCWYRYASENAETIFPEKLGHYWVWRNENEDWKNAFYSETGEWQAWLLENPKVEVHRAHTHRTRNRTTRINPQNTEPPTGQAANTPSTRRSASQESAKRAQRSAQKGDLQLLRKATGSLYESVDFPTAEKYADITPRRRQQLMKEGFLKLTGKGRNRRITVESLIAYCPPKENAK